MKQTSLLMTPPLIDKVDRGRKRVTRRMNGLHEINERPNDFICKQEDGRYYLRNVANGKFSWIEQPCPFGQVGDYIYLKEIHYVYGKWWKNGTHPISGRQEWMFKQDTTVTQVQYSNNPPNVVQKGHSEKVGWYKRSPLFMPKAFARKYLVITDVQLERLSDITEAEAILEGTWTNKECTAIQCFNIVFRKINLLAKDADPWLWAVSFCKASKPKNQSICKTPTKTKRAVLAAVML